MERHRDLLRQRSFAIPHVNPFVHELKLTAAEKIQVFFMSITIVPIRILLVAVLLVVSWVLSFVSTLGIDLNITKPAPVWRRVLFQIVALVGRLQLFAMGFLWINIKGKRASSQETRLLVAAPHSSFFDAIMWFGTMPVPACVSRLENAQAPIFGTLIKTLEPVLVSRLDARSRQKTIQEIRRRARSSENWSQIMIFPEGTCTNRQALITFKGGAFIPGEPVQPVIIRYPNPLDTYTWVMRGPGAPELIWLSLCQIYNRLEVEFLPVYYPNEDEIKNPRIFAENVRLVMADALCIPCTDYTFEDCRLMDQAVSHSLPMEAGLVEFTKLSRKLGLDMNKMKELLAEFAAISKSKDGRMGIDEFAQHLKLPVTDVLKEMFGLYDRDGSGKLDFREYVIGMSLVSHAAVTEETVKLAFDVFDQDCDGYVSKDELGHVLKSVFGSDFNAEIIFSQIDTESKKMVGYNEFYAFAKKRPEYARLFMSYSERKKAGIDTTEDEEYEYVSDVQTSDDTNTDGQSCSSDTGTEMGKDKQE